MKLRISLVCFLGLAQTIAGDPTWPSPSDDLEEVMYQLFGFRSGPGRQNAAEWLRTGFHDMATANTVFGWGGLDASLQFELNNGENAGPGFASTLGFMSQYYNKRTSLSDLLALAVYASLGNSIGTFRDQFSRMGFNNAEMIQLVACGHTLGGVHSAQFPTVVPPGQFPNDRAPLDSTDAIFDNAIVTEYLDDSTDNPLVRGPSARQNFNSDFIVFNSDGNATMRALADAARFRSVCQDVFSRMVDVVPAGVVLSSPVLPYTVKPVNMQLILASDAGALQWSGYIRVRTTEMPLADILNVVVTYKNRYGQADCGSLSCSTTLTVQGVGTGFDESFAFFPIDRSIPVATGISSFTLVVNMKDGAKRAFDNNGNGYPVQDGIVIQKQQSCLLQTSGTFTLTTAVRNDLANQPVAATIQYKTKRDTNPTHLLSEMALSLTNGSCVGAYTLFTGSTTIPGGLSASSVIDVAVGSYKELFRSDVRDAGVPSSISSPPSTSSTSTATSSGIVTSSSAVSNSAPSSEIVTSTTGDPNLVSSTAFSSSSSSSSSVTISSANTVTTQSVQHRPTVGGYELVACWTEGAHSRALKGASFAYDGMTLESCMANCTGFAYWGTELRRRLLGDRTQYCGGGNRLELYSTTAAVSAPTPTATLAHLPTLGVYNLVGCWKEGRGSRAMDARATASVDMTLTKCKEFCNGYEYFGTEYGRECYCGDSLHETSEEAPAEDCSMVCSGDEYQYCGAGNRLELYRRAESGVASSTQAETATTVSFSTSPSVVPFSTTSSSILSSTINASPTPTIVGNFTFQGCITEGSGVRALSQAGLADPQLDLEHCAEFCSNYKYFGTEYASECYCADSLDPSSSEADPSECNMPCSGDASQLCGGPNRLSLYASLRRPRQPLATRKR
ncbi:unnamed protein product [Parascedosporium putredinis]|uniref:WSC domain-containing protein n=1 Tax=Parascedosporium putredinis TaxID=1442378 RepID=A0A9P1GTG2_9PEZI|nr:unnamed protein product [Parascedosporium putredinis]CAI7987322.1 unnamed protein product [Parascedosporium putredinis]